MQDVIKQRLRTVNIVGIAGVILLAAGTVAFGVMPMYRQGTQYMINAENLKKQLASLDGLNKTQATVEVELGETQKRLTEYEKRLPSSSETNTFIKELAKVTADAGIQVESTAYPKDLKDSGGYKSLPVEIVGTGSWESCYQFLTGLPHDGSAYSARCAGVGSGQGSQNAIFGPSGGPDQS